MKICVLGLGYIGLPTASIFATNGIDVVGVDVNESVVRIINNGKIHIEEPGLNTLVQASVNSGKLLATSQPVEADTFIIAVPTPIDSEKKADLSYVIQATESILPYLRKGNLVILESTSPPRTTVDVLIPILQKCGLKIGEELYLAHCPERVLPGNILHELVNNNRIIGGINDESSQKARELYGKVIQGKMIVTDATSAEMAKLMENTFRDVNIALANELSKIAFDLHLDALEVINLANMHPRVHLHQPGPGVGGHCLAVDPWFIVEKSENAKLIHLSREINDSMPKFVANRAISIISSVKDPIITVLGVSYKGNVDDTRESPATEVIQELLEKGIEVRIYDPHVVNYKHELSSLEESFIGSDLVLILSDHNEFKYIDPEALGKLMNSKHLLDTKNCIEHKKWVKSEFKVEILGKYNR